MPAEIDPLVRKRDSAQRALDDWSKRPLRLGTNDCVRMIAAHLRRLRWKVKLPNAGSYRTVNSARKALTEAGFPSVGAALEAIGLEHIAPAATVAGDIMELPAVDGLGCFCIVLGNGRVVGYIDGHGAAQVLQPLEFASAWRVTPK